MRIIFTEPFHTKQLRLEIFSNIAKRPCPEYRPDLTRRAGARLGPCHPMPLFLESNKDGLMFCTLGESMPENTPFAGRGRLLPCNVEEDSGDSLSNLKLQKLVYFAQGFYLAMQGTPLFHEPIRSVGSRPGRSRTLSCFQYRGYRAIEPPDHFVADDYAPEVREILDAVLVVYGQFSAWKLRDIVHEQPPWRDTPPR